VQLTIAVGLVIGEGGLAAPAPRPVPQAGVAAVVQAGADEDDALGRAHQRREDVRRDAVDHGQAGQAPRRLPVAAVVQARVVDHAVERPELVRVLRHLPRLVWLRQVRDEYGFGAGTRLLRVFSSLLASCVEVDGVAALD